MTLLKAKTIILYFIIFFCFGCISPGDNVNHPSTPTPDSTIPPNTNIGDTGYVSPRNVITGRTYDKEKNILSGVKITLKWLNNQDKQGKDITEFITDLNGMYYFRNIVEDTDVELTASKSGYSTVIRKEHINSLKGVYSTNFGGDGSDEQYALVKISLNPPVSSTPAFISSPVVEPTSINSPISGPTPLNGGSFTATDPQLASFYGIVYDINKKPIEGANVRAEFLNKPFQNMDIKTNAYGAFVFSSFPPGTEVRITVSKEGYKTVIRGGILKVAYQLGEDPDGTDRYNFGGDEKSSQYALEKLN
jgi:hypothetical protein